MDVDKNQKSQGKTERKFSVVLFDKKLNSYQSTKRKLDAEGNELRGFAPIMIDNFKNVIMNTELEQKRKMEIMKNLDIDIAPTIMKEPEQGGFMLSSLMKTFKFENESIKGKKEAKRKAIKNE